MYFLNGLHTQVTRILPCTAQLYTIHVANITIHAAFRVTDEEANNELVTRLEGTGKVIYGQEPPSGESTTTECR